MKGRVAEVIVICEDQRHQTILNDYLKECDYGKARFLVTPPGAGSGERFVRETWIPQLAAYRNAASRRRAALVAMVDADVRTVEAREQQLLEVVSIPTALEAVVLLIPKRKIETWILALSSEQSVEEQPDYRHDRLIDKQAVRGAAKTLYALTRRNAIAPENTIPSVIRAIKVLRQFEALVKA